MKRFMIIIFLPLFFGCIPTKNEFDMARFKPNRFRVKPNTNKNYEKIIDTSGFYVAVGSKKFIEKYNFENFRSGMKFYGDGRVGYFTRIDFNNAQSFNPKKAHMGYYIYNGKDFFIEDFYPVPSLVGSRYLLSKKKILMEKSSKDTLVIASFRSAGGGGDTIKYIKKKLPEEFLIFKPDW